MFISNLNSSISEFNYFSCFYYFVQYEMITGLIDSKYSFVGFDNIDANVEAFKTELVNFNSISDSLNNIQQKDF